MKLKKRKFDVLIIGGGPAGAAAAIKLSQIGISVAVLERSNYKNNRIGETLPPEANSVLITLGIWEDFIKDEHLPSPGNISVWGSEQLSEDDFLFNPYGCGWHINRLRFDSMLSIAAEKNGSKVFRGALVKDYFQADGGKWHIYAEHCGENLLFETDYLLLATGRKAKLRLPLGQKIVYDRLVGAVKLLNLKSSIADFDHRTLVEADENGWWYSSVLPQNKLVLAYMTDADLLPKNIKASTKIWERLLNRVSYTHNRSTNCEWNEETYLLPASTYFNLQFSGQKWMAIGDLAFTLDPLSSKGIINALERGIEAAQAIAAYLHKNDELLKEFINQTNIYFAKYLIDRQSYYQLEKRWIKSPFWQRRYVI
jgi:flavin-dependent dehydrogenase